MKIHIKPHAFSRSFVIFLSAAVILSTHFIWSQNLRVTGSWALTVDPTYLPGPGSDLQSTYESGASQVLMDIHGQQLNNYRVTIQRSDITWDNLLHISARRTSDGTGSGFISGGTSYVEAATTVQEFFTGGKNRSNVDLQFQLSGVTVGVQDGTYTTNVVYTVIAL